jgi:hypothetical protein
VVTPTPTPVPAPAPQAAPAPAPAADPTPASDVSETVYLSLWESHWPGTSGQADVIGKSICKLFHGGASFYAVGDYIKTFGFSDADAGTMMGLAITNYCPEVSIP